LTFNGKNNCDFIFSYLACSFLCTTLAVLFLIFNFYNWAFPFALFDLFFVVIFIVVCVKTVKKVELIKDECCNQCTLKITKKCFCSKQYTLMLENSYLLYHKDIMLLNTLKNLRDIDLDNSNIQNYPINLVSKYGIFMGLNSTENEIQLKIDEFLGQKKFENNIYDEIDKYNSLYKKDYSNDIKKIFDTYMKMNEYFYTFFYSDNSVYFRTDFIYSNDFGRLFIGKINKDKYNKTLLINLNEVNKFEMFEKDESDENSSCMTGYLRIMYINEQKEEISICRNKTIYLEKFVLLLNGKLNDIITKT